MMRLGVLCGSSARSMFVANTLCERLDVACIVSEVGREYSWRKLRKHLRFATVRAKLDRRTRRFLFPPDIDQDRFLFPDAEACFHCEPLVHRARHVNEERVADWLRSSAVDALAVFGTSLLRHPSLFELARGRMLNLHGGISPHYRGADSIFWALYDGRIDRIGASIHFVTPRIDGGALVAHVYPAIEPSDGEWKLTCKALRDGALVLAEAFERLAAGQELGQVQPSAGRLYLAHERRIRHDRSVQRRYAAGQLVTERRPARVLWYPHSIGSPSGRELAGSAGRYG